MAVAVRVSLCLLLLMMGVGVLVLVKRLHGQHASTLATKSTWPLTKHATVTHWNSCSIHLQVSLLCMCAFGLATWRPVSPASVPWPGPSECCKRPADAAHARVINLPSSHRAIAIKSKISSSREFSKSPTARHVCLTWLQDGLESAIALAISAWEA